MDFQKIIEKRRSVRKYVAGKTITEKEIKELISAAQEAPTWKNSETGRYYCVLSEEKISEFREKCLPEFNAKNTMNACAYIVTAFEKNISGFQSDKKTTSNELGNEWGAYDLGLQNENILLKAVEMGLSTLVMGIRDEKAIREMFNVPNSQIIVSVISVGYSTEEDIKRPKRLEISEIAQFF